MDKAIDPDVQRQLKRWLARGYVACCSVSLLVPVLASRWMAAAALLPMATGFTLYAVLLSGWWPWRTNGLDPSSVYIRDRYPQIWSKLRPGGYGHDNLEFHFFVSGR